MATPDFILALRKKIGSDPLWLSGVTAVVMRDDRVLLAKRADNGTWTAVTGIIDPGEQPADAAARKVLEETGVVAVPERLAMVHVTDPVVYDNGDQTQYLDLVFRCAWQSGDPRPADGENTAAGWFPLDDLPPMSEDMCKRIAAAVSNKQAAQYLVSPQSADDA
ncbi:NUDIX domain-containing protein [Streptomyces sp. NPDC014734]|uniref:NUDIX hydrolase n=1 Tax=Streptomyces sp. NPDC014734 TaxID=3364886 RepID=UPI0036F5E6E5